MDYNIILKSMYDSNFCFQQMYEDLMDPSMGVASDYASNFSADPFPISSTTDYNRTSSCLLGVVNTMATTIDGHVSHDQMQPGNGIWVPSEASNQGLGFNEMMSGKCVPLEKSVNNIVKGQWTAEEDELLMKAVEEIGVKKWSVIAKKLNGRIGKQCRERWFNHLRPNIKKDNWTVEEDKILIKIHNKVGNKWAKIATHIPGRTENAIKNHWNATKRRQSTPRINSRKTNIELNRTSLLQDYIQGIPIAHEDLEPSSVVDQTPTATLHPQYSSSAITATAASHDTLLPINHAESSNSSSLFYNLDMVNQFLEKNDDASDNDLVIQKSGWEAVLAFEKEIADAAFGNSSNVVDLHAPSSLS